MNCRSQIFILVFFFLHLNSFADKLEKGFEKLKAFDYFAAKGYFEKTLEDEPAAAAFGLSSIYSSDKNPFYSPDSARKYILLSDSAFRLIKEKTKKYYAELGVTDSSIQCLKEYNCEDAFNQSRKGDSVEGYNHYLQYFSSCARCPEVITLRNAAAFADARIKNTSEAYKEFMSLYPISVQYKQAMSKYEELLYDETTSDHSIGSYEKFIQDYPENSYRTEAEKMVFSLTVPDKTLPQYESYVRKYNNGRFAADSWHEIYMLSMKDFSEKSFTRFKESYPDYPFPEELESDFVLQNYFFLPFKNENNWGYINEFGQEMIKPAFEEASFFSDGLAVVAAGGKYGYVNKAGKMIINFRFKDAESFHNGYAVVMNDSLYGLINKKGDFLIKPNYQELSEVSEDIYMAAKDDNSGYIRKNGDSLTGFIFDMAGEFKKGYAIVNKNEKFGLINGGGFYNIEPKFSELVFIGDGLLKALTEDQLWGIVNVQGDTILPFQYDAIGEFSEHRALVAKKGKCGYVDERGLIVIPLTFSYTTLLLTTGQFQNGIALLKQKYKSVIIDTAGKQIILPGYDDCGRPSGGFIPVRKNGKWGFTDMNRKIKIPCKFEAAESFKENLAIVRQNKMAGIIDTTGNFFITPLYEDISIKDKAIMVRSNGKSGLLSRTGILFIPCLYDKIEYLSPSIARATNAEGVAYINLESGKIIFNSGVK